MSGPQTSQDAVGASGYGCLVALAGGALLGAGAAGMLALRAFFAARAAPLRGPGASTAYLASLEWAVALSGAAAVLAVVGAAAAVVLVKELGDEARSRERGPIR